LTAPGAPERWQDVKRLLADALERAPEQRGAFVDEIRSSDPDLAREVASLLGWNERSELATAGPGLGPLAGLKAGERLGHYEVQESIGHGGMGEVYRARDTRLGRDVALKVLAPDVAGDPHALHRFEREGRTVASLSHPNILAIFDVGQQDGVAYAATELLHGENLRQCLERGPVPLAQAVPLARQIASGLAAAHARGIVHRDLKPENVFLTSSGTVKLLDFGLAKRAGPLEAPGQPESLATRAGLVLGTIGYMAPEQVRGEDVDARADVFTFGVVLHEMLSGVAPFARTTPAESLAAILRDEAPPIDEARVPTPIALVARKCLAKDPAARFATAADLLGALDSLPRRLRTSVYRSRRAAAAVLALVTLAAIASQSGVRARPRPADTTIPVGRQPEGLVSDGRHVWVANNRSNSVTKIRSADGAVLGEFRVGGGPMGLAWDGAHVWVANHEWLQDHSTLMRLDPTDGHVLATLSTPGQPMNLLFDGAHLWLTETWPTYLLRKIRPSDGADLGAFTAGGTPRSIAFDGESLWVSNRALASVTKLRPSDGRLLRAVDVGASAEAGLVFDGTHVWGFRHAPGRELFRLRPQDLVIDLELPLPGRLVVGGPWLFVSDSTRHWVTQVRRRDAAVVATWAVGRDPGPLAYDGDLWVANRESHTVSRIAARSLAAVDPEEAVAFGRDRQP